RRRRAAGRRHPALTRRSPGPHDRGPGLVEHARQATAVLSASPRAPASSADSSTTRRPPPSSGTRITMPRPSFVTSSGPSPVRGFIAAILHPLSCLGPHEGLRRGPPPGNPATAAGSADSQPCRFVHLLSEFRGRARRDRVRAALGYLGYAPLGETTWISPRPSVELGPLLEAERLPAERFVASYDGDPRGLLARAWDLDGLGRAYQRWLAQAGELIAAVGPDAPDPTVFALRSALVHEWRKFLFTDPGFPAALLPPAWPGQEAARVFQAESARLLPGASRFVDGCLSIDDPGGQGS